MRLTQIKLTGFKSFAEPTHIHLPGQLVAVMGPNGCGKSNVIDAVRWVLGEASAKQLRGESMQDVIFNGSTTRKPAPRAAVELIFDNSDFALQGAWGQFAEISIKRQLTRQGESTYFINNQVVRRRDITDLFLGTGVGARGYAVIEQGMISRIIEARPEELRTYIEEAAGVSKYKERRRETETRLKDSHEHLNRLNDLQNELSRQIEKLEKQAATAERYQTLQHTLNHKHNLQAYQQWQHAQTQIQAAQEAHQRAANEQTQFDQEKAELTHIINTYRQNEQTAQEHQHSLNQEYAILREQKARLEEQIRAQQAQEHRLQREHELAQVQLEQLAQQEQALLVEQQINQENLAEKEDALEQWRFTLSEHEITLPELEETQQHHQETLRQHQEEHNQIKRELALKEQKAQHIQHNLKQLNARILHLENEKGSLKLPEEDQLTQLQNQTEQLKLQYEQNEQIRQQNEQTLQQARQDFQAADEAHKIASTQLITLQAEQQALQQLIEQHKQHDYLAKTHPNAPVVWQHIRSNATWQHALSLVLAERLHARYLPHHQPSFDNEQHNAIWINRSQKRSNKTPPKHALLHHIQADEHIQAALDDWLDGVLCAPDLAYAIQKQHTLESHQIWITPEGHRVDKHSIHLHNAQNAKQFLQHQTRLETLHQNIQQHTKRTQAAQQRFQEAQTTLNKNETALKHTQSQQHHLFTEWQKAQQKTNELRTQLDHAHNRQQHLLQEQQQLQQETNEQTQQLEQLHHDIDALNQKSNALNEKERHFSGCLNESTERLKQLQQAHLEANRQCSLAELDLQKQQQHAQSLQQQRTLVQHSQQQWQARQQQLSFNEVEKENQEKQQVKLEELIQLTEQLQESLQKSNQEIAQIQVKGREYFEQLEQLNTQLPNIQAALQNTLLQQQEAKLTAQHFHKQLQENHANLDELAQDNTSPDELHREIQELNQKINAIGAVNLAALEELAATNERCAYYQQQVQDVQAAIDLLQNAIEQIDNETKNRFKDTFDSVNQTIQRFFPALFGGGEAKLHLVGDDLLSAGISIMARPPGKKNSTIHLLSGGEKALTAMSLVFSLFSLNPAPFCLLDEVDAPLDDANTARFCKLVEEMSAKTQFLYISHNRLTMEMAEQLIGVTMQEKGVSRIVAVDIQAALNMTEQNA